MSRGLEPLKDHLDRIRREINERQQLGGVQDATQIFMGSQILAKRLRRSFGFLPTWCSLI